MNDNEEEPCALIAHARFCEGYGTQFLEREKGSLLLDPIQFDGGGSSDE